MMQSKLRHSQSQDSNAIANQEIEHMLTIWLQQNESTSLSHGLNLFSS